MPVPFGLTQFLETLEGDESIQTAEEMLRTLTDDQIRLLILTMAGMFHMLKVEAVSRDIWDSIRHVKTDQ